MERGIVTTIGQKCRRCYSCIRECPAKAIRVENGQAVVIEERCISCGHCVKVCSQGAKQILGETDKVIDDILTDDNTAVIVAPSFPASFPENYRKLPAALRKAGFSMAAETAFGADLVSRLYSEYFENGDKTIISSPCPAVNIYIEKYFPELVDNLAKIVSPMAAMGRYIKENREGDTKVVFAGPCVAKKSEYRDSEVRDSIDAVLTFPELKEMLDRLNIDIDEMPEEDFDPPYANIGKSFPLAGGLLKTAEISSDILNKEIIVVEGKDNVEEIIKDISENKIKSKFIDILFCEGCINGPAIDSDLNYYSKREKVISYIDDKIHNVDKSVWKSDMYNSRNIPLKRKFRARSQRRPMPSEEEIKKILASTDKYTITDELNCGACGYHTCREYAVAIAKGLAEEDMCLPYLIEKLEQAYKDLKDAQEQLHNAEKMASIGQLAAGVAHEINNPLGTIMMYASILQKDIVQKMKNPQSADDLQMIIEETNRCKNIVSNLLNFARQGKLKISEIDVYEMVDKIVKNIRMAPEFSDVEIHLLGDSDNLVVEADHDQLKQVFLNLINNACEALEGSDEKKVRIKLEMNGENLHAEIADTGTGISEENKKKLFTPFFTTKKMGKGTGLGLAITYGIVKMHKGDISVQSKEGKGAVFSLRLPVKAHSVKTF